MANLNTIASDAQPSSSLSPSISVNNIDSLEDLRTTPAISNSTTTKSNNNNATTTTSTSESYGYSTATAELLARFSVERARDYDEARNHILNSIVTSDRLPPLPPSQNGSRGPGRPKGSTTKNKAPSGSVVNASVVTTPISTTKKPTGSGRGRGRPRGRKGKRKREDSEDGVDDDDDDDDGNDASDLGEWAVNAEAGGQLDDDMSEDGGVRLPLKTKSGRSVHRPSQFVPTLVSPTNTAAGSARKKRRVRRNAESAVCKACERGHSPANNAIVFCDGCAAAYHQYCHEPPIEKDVIDIPEKEWLCKECNKNNVGHVVLPEYQHFVLGQNLSADEVCVLRMVLCLRILIIFRNGHFYLLFLTTKLWTCYSTSIQSTQILPFSHQPSQ
jgi:PHD-finger